MRAGKAIAQGAHASMAVILENKDHPLVNEWLSGKFTKVCVRVESEEELLDTYNKAKKNGLLTSLITDSGLTEFHGVPTRTCIAIGPAYSEDLEPITGHLKLL
jgi:PTH2 family peptidyl-tRNA hydrolase